MDGLFSMYYVFSKVLFDYLKAYHHISPETGMEMSQMYLTLDTPIL